MSRLRRRRWRIIRGLALAACFAAPAHAQAAPSSNSLVFAIDAGTGASDAALEAAFKGAKDMSAERSKRLAVGVVGYDRRPIPLLAPTTDSGRIEQALSTTPSAGSGRRTLEAVGASLGLLHSGDHRGGTIILMANGSDRGSRDSLNLAITGARRAGVTVQVLAIDEAAHKATELRELAERTGGAFLQTSPDDVDEALAHLQPNVDGFAPVAEAEKPKPAAPSEPKAAPADEGFWGSSLALILVALVCAVPFGLMVRALALRLRGTPADRIEDYTPAPVTELKKEEVKERKSIILTRAETTLGKQGWWPKFVEEIDVARISRPPVQIVLMIGGGTLLALWVGTTIGGSPIFGLIAAVVAFWGGRSYVSTKVNAQRKRFAEQLPDNLAVIASALRAGHSISGALSVVADEADEPSKKEFRQAVADERMGASLEDVLGRVSRRMASRDLEQVAMVTSIQRDTGGNSAEVLDRVTDSVRSRFELQRMVDALTAQGRMSRWIVTALPIVLLIGIMMLNPGYADPLFEETTGRILLGVASGMVMLGSYCIKRIVEIKV